MRREGLGVFPGKNQSCSPCRETHRTGGDYADYDAIQVYPTPQVEALRWERTCRRPSCGVATRCNYISSRGAEICVRGANAPRNARNPTEHWRKTYIRQKIFLAALRAAVATAGVAGISSQNIVYRQTCTLPKYVAKYGDSAPRAGSLRTTGSLPQLEGVS